MIDERLLHWGKNEVKKKHYAQKKTRKRMIKYKDLSDINP